MAYDLYIGLLHKQLSYAMAHGLVPPSKYIAFYTTYIWAYAGII